MLGSVLRNDAVSHVNDDTNKDGFRRAPLSATALAPCLPSFATEGMSATSLQRSPKSPSRDWEWMPCSTCPHQLQPSLQQVSSSVAPESPLGLEKAEVQSGHWKSLRCVCFEQGVSGIWCSCHHALLTPLGSKQLCCV